MNILLPIIIIVVLAGFGYYLFHGKPATAPTAQPEKQKAFLEVSVSLANTEKPAEIFVVVNGDKIKYAGKVALNKDDKFSVEHGPIIYNDSNFITSVSGDCEGVAVAGAEYKCYISTGRGPGAGLHE